MSNANSTALAKPRIEQYEDTSDDAIIAILAEVLCVFAARGRALREERTKHEMAQLEVVASTVMDDAENPQ